MDIESGSARNSPPRKGEEEEEVNDSPIEEVRHTVPITDDPTMPVMTFRTWFLGTIFCVMLAAINEFFGYRQNQLFVSSVCVQLVTLPIGRFMERTLPTRSFKVPLTNWSFSLNPGPFNMKEHVLITIFASTGSGGIYAINIIAIVKAFYHRQIHPAAALLLAQTTQLLGYGWAGLFRKYLVDSSYMWWPSNLVQVSLFRALHEVEKRPKGGLTRLQFFIVALVCSFAYYIVPSYFFPYISSISILCLFFKKSVTMQQIGSGLNGLGILSFGLDWNTVTSFLGTPLVTPAFAVFNFIAGFVFLMYIALPIAYWSNAFNAKKFPIFSSHVFDHDGNPYNITRILTDKSFSLNMEEYENYSRINLSVVFVFVYGIGFAALTATLSHVALFQGRNIIELWQRTATQAHEKLGDVHTRIMKKNYKVVPQWWFHVLLVVVMALSFFTCEGFGRQLQLPWWGLIMACFIAFIFTLPIGIINATTNMQPGLNIITELVIGYIYPGKPLANVVFKTYGYISMSQALAFVQDFKLGHYMKIPPRSMFWAQFVSTIMASSVHFGTAWWLLTSVENICDVANLPKGSPWTCPGDDVFYNASIIWGVVGPLRMFGRLGNYSLVNYSFLIGALAPVPFWGLSRIYPDKEWPKYVNIPVFLSGCGMLLPARAVNYVMWGIVGIFFSWYLFNKKKAWWIRHNYVLAAALDAGIAFMGVLTFWALGNYDIYGLDWWGGSVTDHCPLASCPTAPGVVAKGCPVF
ncbi:hypothetical protein LUZ60_008701 [Juncus effusus]|nr:hypothetical protein LUZ60_008701 [Juncus effusus]